MKTIIQKCAYRDIKTQSGRETIVVEDCCASQDGFGTFCLEEIRTRDLVTSSYRIGKKLREGESVNLNHIQGGPLGNVRASHTITRINDNSVRVIDHGMFPENCLASWIISTSKEELVRYSGQGYTPVLYRGFMGALFEKK